MARVGRPPIDTQPLKKVSVEVRQETMERLDAYIAHRQASDPGAHLSRSDVLRELLDLALATAEPGPRRTKKGTSDAA
jgi:hypothetical protein